jgi:biopolymer transport protein ExbB
MEPVEITAPAAGLTAFDLTQGLDMLAKGGPAIWAIAALSVLTLAIILWKMVRLLVSGAWRRGRAEDAIARWKDGDLDAARRIAGAGHGSCAIMVDAALAALADSRMSLDDTVAETTRVAKRQIARAQSGLRGLELIATVAPLLGLLGTVLGMIAAFQALETAGAQADPSSLAGGIWEALLTTAAGMAVAIPASAALTWFESVIESLRQDMEDMATRIFTGLAAEHAAPMAEAAE